jgi:hypothetical protein
LCVLELGLSETGVVTEVAVQAAIRQAIRAGHLGNHARVHVRVHVVVALHLGRRTMRTVVVILGVIRHGAGRQREVQPDSRKQP